MTVRTSLGVLVVGLTFMAGCATVAKPGDSARGRVPGWTSPLGHGTVSAYADLDASGNPVALGAVFSAHALEGLPASGSDHHHCADLNGDGTVDLSTECVASYEYVLPLPDRVARRADIPFKWILLNWNPHGHIPPGVYDVPHFDVHYYIQPIAEALAVAAGPCGPEHVRCDQFAVGRKPLPSNYMNPDFKDVEAVVPAMGNHLVDLTAPEFHKQGFTRTWIFGVYGGQVTFYEEMVTRAFMLSRPNRCFPIKSPPAVGVGGLYPTLTCIRYDAGSGEVTASIEGFVRREASAPAPLRAKR